MLIVSIGKQLRLSVTLPIAILFLMSFIFTACPPKKKEDQSPIDTTTTLLPTINNSTSVKGYNMLGKLCGIWNGPVTSSTPLGNYSEWIMDLRPISASQVSGKSELDTLNDIFMSFFIVYNNGEYKMAFRNGGSFNGAKRIAYAVIDSVRELATSSYYRFSDFQKGKNRVYTEVIFNSDSLSVKTFTNKYNTLSTPVIHMHWKARLKDSTSTQIAINNFSFPMKTLVKDFSTTFSTLSESVYYSTAGDPYPEAAQPYVGETTVNYTVASNLTIAAGKKILLIITSKSLLNNNMFDPNNLAFRSRYVILDSSNSSFVFKNMHPGTYYLYAVCDNDNNSTISSGDYFSYSTTNSFTLSAKGSTSKSVQINYTL